MALKGHIITPEHRQKVSQALVGRKPTKEVRQKMSASAVLRARNGNKTFVKGAIRVVGIITIRWNSSRLPGKALALIGTQPALQLLVDRVKLAKYLDDYIVATTVNSQPIIDYCQQHDIHFIADSEEDDILGRLYKAAQYTKANLVVRLWGDAPLISPKAIDFAVFDAKQSKADYFFAKNGMTDECIAVIPFRVLERKHRQVDKRQDREWFHKYMLTDNSKVLIRELESNVKVKLTLDTQEDLKGLNELWWSQRDSRHQYLELE